MVVGGMGIVDCSRWYVDWRSWMVGHDLGRSLRNHQGTTNHNLAKMALWDALETPWGPLVPSMAIPWGLLVPFGATGRAFGGQMGSSWAKPGTQSDPNLSQNVIQNVTKSKAEIRSNFGCDLGAYVGQKMTILRCLVGCGMSFLHTAWNP